METAGRTFFAGLTSDEIAELLGLSPSEFDSFWDGSEEAEAHAALHFAAFEHSYPDQLDAMEGAFSKLTPYGEDVPLEAVGIAYQFMAETWLR